MRLLWRWILKNLAHERERDVEVVGRRVVACLMDCLLVALLSSSAFAPLLFARPSLLLALVTALLFALLFCVLYFVYAVLFEGFRGQTLGKAVLGLEVIR